jgi:DNA-directed RNA polymerase sigma subunit (sigma70/sigma32)
MKTIDESDGSPAWESKSLGARDHGDTSITLYLRDIGQVKLLTRLEEIELAARIKRGDREAREQMIKANLRLVVKIARAYQGIGVPLLDLISEGNIGLLRAVERFDPSKGAKFSYYAASWIKQAITQALTQQSKTIRWPIHVVHKLGEMSWAALRLEEELGRKPTDEELAAEMGMSSSRVNRMRMAAICSVSLDASIDWESTRSCSISTLIQRPRKQVSGPGTLFSPLIARKSGTRERRRNWCKPPRTITSCCGLGAMPAVVSSSLRIENLNVRVS